MKKITLAALVGIIFTAIITLMVKKPINDVCIEILKEQAQIAAQYGDLYGSMVYLVIVAIIVCPILGAIKKYIFQN